MTKLNERIPDELLVEQLEESCMSGARRPI